MGRTKLKHTGLHIRLILTARLGYKDACTSWPCTNLPGGVKLYE